MPTLEHLLFRAADLGSAAALAVSRNGSTIFLNAAGTVMRPEHQRNVNESVVKVSASTKFDFASVTKPIVATAILLELYSNGLSPDIPISSELPEFQIPSLKRIKLYELLNHTAGFCQSNIGHVAGLTKAKFRKISRPEMPESTSPRYSCSSYVWAGIFIEELTGLSLQDIVRNNVSHPLGMRSIDYLPSEQNKAFIPATEYKEGRGFIQGSVHDELAHSLGGITGNSGLFGNVSDLLKFAQLFQSSKSETFLPDSVRKALISPSSFGSGQRSLAFEIDTQWTRSLNHCISHTGFTGTACLSQPQGPFAMALLTNRVHPTRENLSIFRIRREIVDAVARL